MWEQLKRDARQLEGEVEVKLSQYSRLSSGVDSSGAGPSGGVRSLQGASDIHSDITSLLKRLQDVHNAMEVDVSGSDIRHHTVIRHREILQDFSHEFRRLSAQLDQVRRLLCWRLSHERSTRSARMQVAVKVAPPRPAPRVICMLKARAEPDSQGAGVDQPHTHGRISHA